MKTSKSQADHSEEGCRAGVTSSQGNKVGASEEVIALTGGIHYSKCA